MTTKMQLAYTALLSTMCFGATTVFAQDPAPATKATPAATTAMPPQEPVAQAPTSSGQESSEPQTLHLLVGRSLVITSPSRIKRVSLADPEIAEAIVVSPTQVLVNGKKPGGVSLLLWDEADQSQAFEVSVDIDVLGLSQKIHEVFPAENVHIDTSKDVVIITGKISSSVVADKILEVVKGAAPKVTSMMEVPPVPTGEILLQVRFAEVDRSALTELGFNILSTGLGKTIGAISTQQFGGTNSWNLTDTFPVRGPQGNPSETFTVSQTIANALNIFLFNPNIHLGTVIQALQSKNLFQILAEPNLMTESGKEATFLAGGEFPYPLVTSVGSGSPTVSVQFKEYGIRLSFTPLIGADGTIHLKVKPEVSTLDYSNAIVLSGFTLPALSTRRVESEMSLADGQTFAIAGLVDNRVTELMSKIPGIGDIPILGKLFQSKSLNKTKNELLVIVTPHVVRPLSPDQVPHGPNYPQPFLDQIIPAQTQAPSSK